MVLTAQNILLIGSLLLFLAIIASKTAGKTGIPVLLLFMGVGIMAGSEGLGKIAFDDLNIAQFLGIISLTFILFSGGLDTRWAGIKPVLWHGVMLSTLGVLATTLSLGYFVSLISNFSLLESMLLGAIVSSTDAAAVFSILRTKSIGLKGNLRPLLELESGSNDPMAFFLTIGLTSILTIDIFDFTSLVPVFILQMVVGGAGGFIMGKGITLLMNKINLEYEGLYPVLMLALVSFTYTFIDFLGGNGFLAVYICALVISNGKMLHKKSLIKFFDGVAWLMQIVMFITLGLLVYPSHVFPIMGIGLLSALFLIFVARPVGVFLSLVFFRYKMREKLFVSWVGLRGAVPIVFATFPLIANVDRASDIFNIVFFIVITSVILQATTLSIVAKWLHLAVPEGLKKRSLLDLELSEDYRNSIVELVMPTSAHAVGKSIVDLDFPKTSLIVLIKRGNKFITPNGLTVIEAGDELMIMMKDEHEEEKVKKSLGI